MLEIIFRVEVHPAKRQEFLEFIEWDARVAQEEERESGSIWFDFFDHPVSNHRENDVGAPHYRVSPTSSGKEVFVYECYVDEIALEAHKQNEPFRHWEKWIQPNVLLKFQHLYIDGQVMDAAPSLSFKDRDVLKDLNGRISAMEQQRDAKAKEWFGDLLSNCLIFRRATGSEVDKQTFVKHLDDTNPFTSRTSEDVCVIGLDHDRALVTLIVHTTKPDRTHNRYRNIRLFSRHTKGWTLDRWHNYDVTSL